MRTAQTGPPNDRKSHPVCMHTGRLALVCTRKVVHGICFLSRQHDVMASFSLSKPNKWEGLVCPLDRVLTYKNLIYLLNLQFYSVNTSYPMDNC